VSTLCLNGEYQAFFSLLLEDAGTLDHARRERYYSSKCVLTDQAGKRLPTVYEVIRLCKLFEQKLALEEQFRAEFLNLLDID